MYDYVIVGAGSAGCVLASRLSEDPDAQVLLLEAGPPDVNENIHVPLGYLQLGRTEVDWDYCSAPEPECHGRRIPLPRGKVLGGSSSINAMVYIRGNHRDYDDWGVPGWSWADLMPYFLKAEDNERGASRWHGAGGPLPVSEERSHNVISRAFVEAGQSAPVRRNEDFNGERQDGVGLYQVTQRGGMRASTAVAYLHPAMERPNLTVMPYMHVQRVLFEGTRAVGVQASQLGQAQELRAEREVILCGGAYNSPQLLMLSGVGPAELLTMLQIPVVAELPAVGQNLQDHPFAPVLTLLREPTQNVGVRAELKFTTAASGGLKDDMMMFPSVLDPATMNMKDVDTKGLKALTLVSLLAKPRSVGWLTLSSADPHVQPELHVNFLSDPSDIERLMESVRLAYELATTSPLREEIAEILFPDADTVAGDEELEAYILSVASTSYHASCTCRMGPAGDPGAVVSQRLAVHGTECLFVADASVFPNVPTGLTNLTAYMTGERLAEWLLNPAASAA